MSQVASSNEWSRQVAAARKQCGEDVGKHLTRIEKLNQSRLAHAYCAGKALAERKSHMGKRWRDGLDITPQWGNRLIQLAVLIDNDIGKLESALSDGLGVDSTIKVLKEAAAPPKPERTKGDDTDKRATEQAQAAVTETMDDVRPVAAPTPTTMPVHDSGEQHGDWLLEEIVSHVQSLAGTERRNFVFDLVEILKTESPESFNPKSKHYLDAEVVREASV